MSRAVWGTLIAALVVAGALAAGAAEMGLADPTRPAHHVQAPSDGGEDVGAAGAAMLDSIFIRGERRWAVIGGERFEVGDHVGGPAGARVIGIDLWGVRLRDASGDWVLKLTGEFLPVGLGNDQ